MDLPIFVILGAALPVFLLLGLGMLLRQVGILRMEADASLMNLVVRVFYPALFLDFIVGNPAVKTAPNLVSAPLVGFLTTVGGFLVGYALARLLKFQRGHGLRTFAFCGGIYNYGYIPIPLIMALFASRETLGVLLVHNVGVEIAIWTTGIVLLSGRLEKGAVKRLLNPPTIALALALGINFTGLDQSLPQWWTRFVHLLAMCAIPVGILLSGATIADLLGRGIFTSNIRATLGACVLRLGLMPAVFLGTASLIPGLSLELKQVIVVQAAMPSGILPIVLARHYGGDPSVAVKVVLGTTFVSVLTMPLWLKVGSALIL